MRFLFALCALSLAAGCAGGGMNATPSAAAAAAARQGAATDANGCFRRNRYVTEEDLETGVKWRLHPDKRPDKFVGIALAHNALRTVTLVIRPWNDPKDVIMLEPGGSVSDVAFTRPTFEIVIHEKKPAFDHGPGAKINAVVCPE
jgi:hypothetical protein